MMEIEGGGAAEVGESAREDQSKPQEEEDPMRYNTWRKILKRPASKAKGKALVREVLSGLTVAVAQVPEAVAFAFTAGVPPLVGLQAAWMMGLITALLGGAPGQVSGATGAIAVVLPDFVRQYGLGYLFIAVLLMGVIELVFGVIGGAKLIKLVGNPVMLGFCNGLAIVIGLAQAHSFQIPKWCPEECNSPTLTWNECLTLQNMNETTESYYKCETWATGAEAGWQSLEVVATMAMIYLLPKATKAFPASLAGILLSMLIEFALVRPLGYKTITVEDLAVIQGSFPIPIWADNDYKQGVNAVPSLAEWETYRICLPISATMAVIGLVESLMTMRLVGQITNHEPNGRNEALAQGLANVVTGIFGGMGGCAMIGQSMINVRSGGVTRISTVFSALFLLSIILVAYPAINLIPMAGLAGVMFMVVIGTFEWHSLYFMLAAVLPRQVRENKHVRLLKKIKRSDALIVFLVTVIEVFTNLAYAVAAGTVLASLVFAWDQEKLLSIEQVSADASVDTTSERESLVVQQVDPQALLDTKELPPGTTPDQVKVYQVSGPLFFASAEGFVRRFHPRTDPPFVYILMDQAILSDYSALVAINDVARTYRQYGKKIFLRKVSPGHLQVLRKANHLLFVYDREQPESVNQDEISCMEHSFAPSWQAADLPALVNVYSDENTDSFADKRDSSGPPSSVQIM